MRKTIMLAAAAVAVSAVAACGSSTKPHASAHPLALAPVTSAAPGIKDSADRTACLMWRKSASALADETATAASWPVTARKAIGAASDAAFKRDAAATVTDYEAAQKASSQQTNEVLQMTEDLRNADNDCAADGIAIDGMTS